MIFSEFYASILGINPAAKEPLPYPVHSVSFKRGDFLTAYGQTEDCIYFLNEGIVEMTIESYMSEKIIDFFLEGDMFLSLTSFLNHTPSNVQINALTACKAEVIRRKDLYEAYAHSFEANKFGRLMIEKAYMQKAQREKDFLSKTAEQRYAEMINAHSNFINLVPVNKIARYLGIHPESLSRIRKKINS